MADHLIIMCAKDEEPIPLSYWLLVGGRGPPPTRRAFQRMASERKAAHRHQISRKAARKEAFSKAAEAYEKATEEHGTPGLTGLLKRSLGLEKKSEKPRRSELVEFGGQEKSLRRTRRSIVEGGETNGGLENPAPDRTPDNGAGGNNSGDVGGAGIGEDGARDGSASGSDQSSAGGEDGGINSVGDSEHNARSTEPKT